MNAEVQNYKQRREFEREAFSGPATIRFEDDSQFDAEIRDITPKGLMAFVSGVESLPSESAELKFLLLGKARAIVVRGKICWSKLSWEGATIGFEFNEAPTEILEQYWKQIPTLRSDRII